MFNISKRLAQLGSLALLAFSLAGCGDKYQELNDQVTNLGQKLILIDSAFNNPASTVQVDDAYIRKELMEVAKLTKGYKDLEFYDRRKLYLLSLENNWKFFAVNFLDKRVNNISLINNLDWLEYSKLLFNLQIKFPFEVAGTTYLIDAMPLFVGESTEFRELLNNMSPDEQHDAFLYVKHRLGVICSEWKNFQVYLSKVDFSMVKFGKRINAEALSYCEKPVIDAVYFN